MDQQHLSSAIKSFPLLGLFQGIIYYSMVTILMEFTPFSTLAISFLLWAFMIVLTGGIHLDGWMDASDAYFSYQDHDKRLEIMKDPRTGAFGVLSVIFILAAKFFFIYEIFALHSNNTLYTILLIPFLSKLGMGLLLQIPPAKQEGLAHMFHKSFSGQVFFIYPLYVSMIGAAWIGMAPNLLIHFFTMVVITSGAYLFIRLKCKRWFSGMTGDVLGAAVEGIETILWMSVWLLHYFVMV
ncbi:adenosylcobinamide-GDP ribazoletransferase [Pseudalkalibacillus sp. SCS-8]|uniref:adenosylcobinamide-GDP ribazoletransferase n=1 Tax=Pseudalkalibacillus nanhaiensis TaxID=3115291 RepID=UPI0032DA8620